MIFSPVSLSVYPTLRSFFSENPYSLSIYSPASLIAWSYKLYKTYFALEDGQLYIAGQMDEDQDTSHLILPLSNPVAIYAPAALHDMASRCGFARYWYIPGDYLEKWERTEWERFFVIEEQPEYHDYVYRTEDLIGLKGNKFSKKRNLIHQFSRDYLRKDRVNIKEIGDGDIDECLKFLEIWCDQHDCDTDQETNLACEKNAVTTALKNMTGLEFKGIVIRIDGTVVAFGIGSRLNGKTATLNFEKADARIKGLYQFLDNECAKRLFQDYAYINKESDMNIPNLAESKQSYNPVLRVKSFKATLLLGP
jgi:hypothetical protein